MYLKLNSDMKQNILQSLGLMLSLQFAVTSTKVKYE